MVFLCQKNSYLRSVQTLVKSCEPSKKFPGKFDVQFEDVLIFPDGGGQPSDHGTVLSSSSAPVAKISDAYRSFDQAFSIVDQQLKPDEKYTIEVDFARRFDHMQQHTGQHLLSAIAEAAPFNWETTSWWLGDSVCKVELDTKSITPEQLKDLEARCNAAIRNTSHPIVVHVTDKAGADELGAKTRGLPDDHCGALRVVEIPGIDVNLCCGTHMSTLKELQMIKLLGVEKGKKGKTLLNFIVGGRIIDHLNFAIDYQAKLTLVLKGGPREHFTNATATANKMKLAERGLKSTLLDLAKLEVENYKALAEKPKVVDVHKRDASFDYLNFLSRGMDQGQAAVLTVGDEKDKNASFQFIILSEKLEENGKEILELLEGKGSAKNGRMQGKCNSLKKRKKVLELI